MAVYQQYGQMHGYSAGESGFQFPQAAATLGSSKQSTFSFRKRFEKIDWKRLGKFVCLCLCVTNCLLPTGCREAATCRCF